MEEFMQWLVESFHKLSPIDPSPNDSQETYVDEKEIEELRVDILKDAPIVRHLGRGGCGSIDLIHFRGEEMVMKTYLKGGIRTLFKEIHFHNILAGAGGAPIFHYHAFNPLRLVMSYTGMVYGEYLMRCSQQEMLDSLVKIADRLQELHENGVIHNDLKIDNVTVKEDDFHLIDLGLSTFEGRPLGSRSLPDIYEWIAPEVRRMEPTSPASDVYSLGNLVFNVRKCVKDADVRQRLLKTSVKAMNPDPRGRPTLRDMITDLLFISDLCDD